MGRGIPGRGAYWTSCCSVQLTRGSGPWVFSACVCTFEFVCSRVFTFEFSRGPFLTQVFRGLGGRWKHSLLKLLGPYLHDFPGMHTGNWDVAVSVGSRYLINLRRLHWFCVCQLTKCTQRRSDSCAAKSEKEAEKLVTVYFCREGLNDRMRFRKMTW